MLTEPTQDNFVTLTSNAATAVNAILTEKNLPGYALRIFIAGGSCSGLQYGMALVNEFFPDDMSAVFDGVKVIVDKESLEYLKGSTIDYIETEEGTGFTIQNPNPLPSCGYDASASGCSGCG